MEIAGLFVYLMSFMIWIGIFGLLALGLNIQWGYAGMLNIGIVAFFAVGAYTSAILTIPVGAVSLTSFGLPLVFGFLASALICGLLAFLIGLITLRLRTDYLAIATIGIAEIIRLFLKNETDITGGVRGLEKIPQPFREWSPGGSDFLYMLFVLACLAIVYIGCERLYNSPWGRVQRAIRDNETAANAMGKNILSFRLQAFVAGAMIMGFAGAVYAHYVGFISPESFTPLIATFLVWVMLIAGGSGNNKGVLIGSFVVWAVWSGAEILISRLPETFTTQAGSLRILLVGLLLVTILLYRPGGILPEKHAQGQRDKVASKD